MPRYSYICEKCEKIFSVTHSMKEKLKTCDFFECDEGGTLKKTPSSFSKKKSKESIPGEVVQKYIEDVKQEVKEEKEVLKKKEYKL